MATQFQLVLMDDPTHGINLAKASHVVAKADMNSWRYVEGFELDTISLTIRKTAKKLITAGFNGINALLTLENLSSYGEAANSYLLGLGFDHVYRVRLSLGNVIEQTIALTPGNSPWSFVPYGTNYFATRPGQKVCIIRYNRTSDDIDMRPLDDTTDDPIDLGAVESDEYGTVDNMMPGGRFIGILDGHVVVAYTTETHTWDGTTVKSYGETRYFKTRIRWSSRDTINQGLNVWTPGVGQNADFLDINVSQQKLTVDNEITGMNSANSSLYVYTKRAIFQLSYVGPSAGTMSLRQVVSGVGCVYSYGVVSFGDLHYFPGPDNFYVFDGATVTKIGAPIWELFNDIINTDVHSFEVLWSAAYPEKNEVVWCVKQVGQFTNFCCTIVYNVYHNCWYVNRTPKVLTRFIVPQLVENSTGFVGREVTVSKDEVLYVSLDNSCEITEQETPLFPTLISHDIQFDDPEAVKEVSSFYLDAEIDNIIYNDGVNSGEIYWGVAILVSVRDSTSEPLQFHYENMWTYDVTSEGFPVEIPLNIRTSGRILNFALVPLLSKLTTHTGSMEPLFEKTYADL